MLPHTSTHTCVGLAVVPILSLWTILHVVMISHFYLCYTVADSYE